MKEKQLALVWKTHQEYNNENNTKEAKDLQNRKDKPAHLHG